MRIVFYISSPDAIVGVTKPHATHTSCRQSSAVHRQEQQSHVYTHTALVNKIRIGRFPHDLKF